MKPILIDALHINMGGALMILNHLVDKLVEREIDFVLLKDERCAILKSEKLVKHLVVSNSSINKRFKYYLNHKDDYSTVICLGNIPPPIRLTVTVNTYIHNVSLLQIPDSYSFKSKIKTWLKYRTISLLSGNTDNWIVQTSHTANLVRKYLPVQGKDVLQYPFYYIPSQINQTPFGLRSDYVFVGEETGAKGLSYLILAWKKLARQGFDKVLHLTTIAPELQDILKDAIEAGANIKNHGRIGFDEVVSLYNKSKAIIYPSMNESLGLGVIEAAEAGCDVIGCNLEYLHAVCVPSCTFLPQNSDSIVEAVLKYEKGSMPKTTLKIQDKVDEFIKFIES